MFCEFRKTYKKNEHNRLNFRYSFSLGQPLLRPGFFKKKKKERKKNFQTAINAGNFPIQLHIFKRKDVPLDRSNSSLRFPYYICLLSQKN